MHSGRSLVNEKTIPSTGRFGQDFFNILPSAMLRYNIDKEHNVRIFYRSSTQLPSVDQLQDVLNNTNPLQLSVGNPDLKQSFQNSVFLRYQSSNPEKSSTFFAMAGGSLTNNNISNATYLAGSDDPIFAEYNIDRGAQITRPVNLDGNYSLRSFVSYGQPIKWIRSNINLDASYTYSRTTGLLNEELNYASSNNVGVGVTIASNISEKVDFAISTRPTWSHVNNSLQSAANNDYLIQNSKLKFNWIIFEGFVLRTDLINQNYTGLSDDFNQSYWLWNLGIGKKILKNDRGEITLSVNDLLNQNRNISRNITETYIEDVQSNALQQFFMLSFSYNLRNFNTGKSASEKPGGDEPMRMYGPPPH
ncbi:MAG: TonB-dependent receptor [Lewinellaceae bacterium]|nr:TonB-dependent receptor [Lewinellaceae bacterium]